jgi:multicomponent Na+:H+ antiporter subunit B
VRAREPVPPGRKHGREDLRGRALREHEPTHRTRAGGLLAAGMLAVLAAAMVTIPREHAPLPAIARYALVIALPQWRLTEPVNEIVYGTRGFDTFGETFLLLAAVMSVIVLTRPREPRRGYFGEETAGAREQAAADPGQQPTAEERRAREAESQEEGEEPQAAPGAPGRPDTPDAVPLGTPAPERADAMTVVVRGGVRTVLPLLAVAGLYLVAWGYSPGGGFPGGAVILGVVLLAYAGYGRRRISRVVRPAPIEITEVAFAAFIILIELLGLVLRGSFSANWLPLAHSATIFSGGIAQLFSVSELVEVGTGLIIAVFAVLGATRDWVPDTSRGGIDDRR